MLRTGLYKLPLNPGKQARVEAVLRAYRACAATLAAGQWRLLFKTGRFDKNAKLFPATTLSARYVQTCQYQVVGALQSFLANCANAYRDCVRSASFDEPTRIALLYLGKYCCWYKGEVKMQGKAIDAATLRLARNIMRGVLARHRKPNLRRCNMALDQKVALVERARSEGHFGRWVRLSTLEKSKPVWLPVGANPWFDGLQGEEMPFVQVNRDERGRLWAGLIKDVAATPYASRLDVLGLDVGLKVLLASSEGELLGQHLLGKLQRFDRQISTLAANRQRMGLRTRSARYDLLVRRMRSFLKNEIHRTLRQVLLRHKPAHVAIELLDFRSPELSRRMNRLVQNFGRTEFRKALEGFSQQYGFHVLEVEPAYSSQACNACGYVDARNRAGSVFRCLHCGHHTHADVNASRNHAQGARKGSGRSGAEHGGRRVSRGQVLQQMVERFATPRRLALLQRRLLLDPGLLEQSKRRHSSPRLSMLSNPYFATVLAPLRARAAAHAATHPLPGSRAAA